MTLEDISKLRAYIEKNHKYDFKTPINGFVFEVEEFKESKTSTSGTKYKEIVKKRVKYPCEIIRAIISFVPCDNPPKLLYMIILRGTTIIKSEEDISFK